MREAEVRFSRGRRQGVCMRADHILNTSGLWTDGPLSTAVEERERG